MSAFSLPFEKPVVDLLARARELEALAGEDPKVRAELRKLEERAGKLAREIFSGLTPWQKVQVSRHPARPYTLDYIGALITEFTELHGDRRFGEDAAIVCGLGRFRGESVVVVGQQKGRGAKDNVVRNFGMPHPEGYRKACRMYELAARFGLPVLTFIDTPGAYPGIGAEERGQSEAIGACLSAMARAPVPIVATIIGEGGSGGALALGVANTVQILEYSTYSVISPEGCASILWKDSSKAEEAAERLKITATDLLRLGVVDTVIEEPAGGAHAAPAEAATRVGDAMATALARLRTMDGDALVADRYARFRKLGVVAEA
jgi:acetyl-CoA carboxylase carboxyl transferase subunit alpha